MKTLSLRSQIFISLIFLVLLSSVLIATVSIFQYNEQSKKLPSNAARKKRKSIKKALNYIFKNQTTNYLMKTFTKIFKNF